MLSVRVYVRPTFSPSVRPSVRPSVWFITLVVFKLLKPFFPRFPKIASLYKNVGEILYIEVQSIFGLPSIMSRKIRNKHSVTAYLRMLEQTIWSYTLREIRMTPPPYRLPRSTKRQRVPHLYICQPRSVPVTVDIRIVFPPLLPSLLQSTFVFFPPLFPTACLFPLHPVVFLASKITPDDSLQAEDGYLARFYLQPFGHVCL